MATANCPESSGSVQRRAFKSIAELLLKCPDYRASVRLSNGNRRSVDDQFVPIDDLNFVPGDNDEQGKEVYLERFTAKAAAGLHTTLEDLILFAKAEFEGNSVLSKSTIRSMTEPLPITKSNRGAYGLGYSTYFFVPYPIRGHARSNTGWESGFMIDFEDNSGVIILTNGSNGKNVAVGILRRWLQWKQS